MRYYRALQKYLRQGSGLYVTDWASMDNSPRNAFLKGGGCAIDTSSQMALFGRNLATIAESLGKAPEAAGFAREADDLGAAINALMWEVASAKPLGVERFRFNGHVVPLKAEPAGGDRPSLKLSVSSDGPFKLLVRHGGREETYAVAEGQNAFSFPPLKRT